MDEVLNLPGFAEASQTIEPLKHDGGGVGGWGCVGRGAACEAGMMILLSSSNINEPW